MMKQRASFFLAFLAPLLLAFLLAGPAVAGSTATLSYDGTTDRLFQTQAGQLSVSQDQGQSWQPVPLPAAVADTALIAAAVPATASAPLYIAGPGIGVQRSTDEGAHWQALNDGLPDTRVIAFALHRTQPETLYAVLAESGIHRSEDGGQSWQRMDSGPTQGIHQLLHADLPDSMQTGWLVAASAEAVRLSMDCFCGWRLGGDFQAGTVHSVTYDADQPKRLYAAAEQGVFLSENGGQDWQRVSRQTPALVALTVGKAGRLYATQRGGAVVFSDDRGKTWTSAK